MEIVFAGDSITKGAVGVNYLKLIEKDFPACRIINLGLGGDTAAGITRRLERCLAEHKRAAAVFLQAGHNDVLLPLFRRRAPGLRCLAALLEKRGSRAEGNPALFAGFFEKRLLETAEKFHGQIVLLTLSCVNEYMHSEAEAVRRELNENIRRIAGKHGFLLADVGAAFDDLLGNEGKDVEIRTLGDIAVSGYSSVSLSALRRLSRNRGLKLTIDGVHLNEQGAQVYRRSVSPVIELLMEKVHQEGMNP